MFPASMNGIECNEETIVSTNVREDEQQVRDLHLITACLQR
jgi:hypothetical protein